MKTRLALVFLAAAAWAGSGMVTVVVDSAKVRKTKAFYAPSVATVHYKETLEAGPAEDGWLPVTAEGQKGWLHESAVASKAGKVRAGNWEGGDEASQDEVTLAGKGFNAEVEEEYRRGDAGDYPAVNKMEERSVDESNLIAFMRSGKTLPKGAR